MPKGFFTQSACVLLSQATSLDSIIPLLNEFSIAKRVDQTSNPNLGGPSLILPFRPEVNGYPCSGFVLSSQFSSVGGLPSLHRLCGDCPANGDDGIAGCVGSFHQALYSKELQEQLDRLIDRLGLAQKFDAIFPQTGLHWFRFWIQSPIPAEGVAPLLQLLEAVHDEDEQELQASGKTDLRGFNSLHRAAERGDVNVVKLMLQHGAKIDVAAQGHTALSFAEKRGHAEVVKLLEEPRI